MTTSRSSVELHARRKLDVGCDTGLFPLLAATAEARVVAVDSHPTVRPELWGDRV
jgi:ribosomal protein L11 methylase PrmA